MKYALARYYRKNREAFAKARAVLATIPGDAATMARCRGLVGRAPHRGAPLDRHQPPGQRKAAYQIAKAHGFAPGRAGVEGEFLAGWIALR